MTITNVTGTTFINTGLTNGTTYYFVVSATNSYGGSTNSIQASATPVPAPVTLVWSGAINGNWDTTTANWLANGVPAVYQNGSPVQFDDTALSNTTVTVSAPVSPASVVVSNTVLNYLLSGSAIAGTNNLTKLGGGTLTLAGANTYTGGTFVNGGSLIITNTVSALAGAVAVNSGGSLFLSVGGGVTYPNNISGVGAVYLAVGGGNTFLTGDLHLFTGTLDISGGGAGQGKLAYGTATSPTLGFVANSAIIKVEAGNTFFTDGNTGTSGLSFGCGLQLYGADNGEGLGALRMEKPGDIWSGSVTLLGNSSIGNNDSGHTAGSSISGTISQSGGSFGLAKVGGGRITLAGTNTYSGVTTISAGNLVLANTLAVTNSTVDLEVDQGLGFATASNFLIGGLSGGLSGAAGFSLTNLSGGAVTLSVGNNNSSSAFSGAIAGPGSLVKTGTGTLVLSGANTYTGGTFVNGGTLRFPTATNLPSGLQTNYLQIWPLGDSITWGFAGGNVGYRGPLFNLLSVINTNFLYVGSSTNIFLATTLPTNQWHNDGHGSYAINNIYTNLDGFDNSVFLQYGGINRDPNGGHWLDGITSGTNARPALYPDIITLLIGANDQSNPNTQTNLDRLVSKLVTLRPNAHLIVARITPISGNSAFVTNYNQVVDAVVAKYSASNLVSEVDLNTGFPAGGLSGDGLHPDDTGFNWMASQWYNAIVSAVGMPNLGIPVAIITTNSPVTVAAGATFDPGPNLVTIGSLTGSGNVTLDGGGMLTINIPGATSTFSGTISGAGGLAKAGSGILWLNGTNTYNGGTMVNAGELIVTPIFFGGSSVAVCTNAIFGVTNSIAASASLSNLTLNAGTTLECFGASSLTTSLMTASNLLVNGVCTIKLTGTNGLVSGNTYPIINYAGGFSGSFANLQLQLPAGMTGMLVSNAHQVAVSLITQPAAPTNLTATAGDAQVILNWNPAAYATGYNVKQAAVSGGSYSIVATNISPLTFTNTGLSNGMLYYFVVSATNSVGESTNSAEASARPVSLATPQIIITTGNGQLQFGWSADHTGWSMQAQTNPPGGGLGTNWVFIPISNATNQMTVPISPINGSVFFRLSYP
jgi:autotransporter-associated beta strand protein